jgi:hypothetical protein
MMAHSAAVVAEQADASGPEVWASQTEGSA